jgi:hypothetical protein
MSSQAQTRHSSLHDQVRTNRHEGYRQLAHIILGPRAPQDDAALTQALAEHARLLALARAVRTTNRRRAA